MVVQLHFPNQVFCKCDVVYITSKTCNYIELTRQDNLYNVKEGEIFNKIAIKSIY